MHVFYSEFFEIIENTIVTNLWATASECWLTTEKYPRDRWSNISLFPVGIWRPKDVWCPLGSVIWGFLFWVIAFHGPFHAMKEFIFKLFMKALRNSLKLSEICALLSVWYCYLHNFFPCSFHIILIVEELKVEVSSFEVRRSSLIIFFSFYIMKNFID